MVRRWFAVLVMVLGAAAPAAFADRGECYSDSDCAGGKCHSSKCTTAGGECYSDSDCAGGKCHSGKCTTAR